MLPIAANAQREYNRVCGDDLYLPNDTKDVVYDFDEVIDERVSTKNVLIEHNQVVNYYHKNVVSEKHFYLDGTPIRYRQEYVREHPIYYKERYVREYPSYYSSVPYEYYNEFREPRWHLYFDFNSSRLNNEDELKDLIRYALYYYDLHLYIYVDGNVNDKLSRTRNGFIVDNLLMNGIRSNRIHTIYTNKYSCIVKITASRKK